MNKAIIILGPTSTGKTDLGLFLAKKFNGEIISSDSRQVYKGLDVGTGKIPSISKSKLQITKRNGLWEIDGIKVYCLDVADPKKQYSVKNFVDNVASALEKVEQSKKLPIIVGGTGFYIRALTEGIDSLFIPKNKNLRKKMENLTLDELQHRLRKVAPKKWSSMNNSDRQNKRRLIRVIELAPMYGYIRTQEQTTIPILLDFDLLKIGLSAPLNILREKIRKRVDLRFKQGLIKEAKNLQKNGLSLRRMKELGLDYKILAQYLEGEIDKKTLREQITLKNGQYAKRQITWFKKEKGVSWFDITNKTYLKEVERLVSVWYD